MTFHESIHEAAESEPRRGCGAVFRDWKPFEILALVLGFALYWPLGLIVLGLKFAQKKGWGDAFGAARNRFTDFSGSFRPAPQHHWRPFQESSGNAAFDEWRRVELDRLAEQRRGLEAAQKEFADHVADLKRARDREEFDRFMAARRGTTQV